MEGILPVLSCYYILLPYGVFQKESLKKKKTLDCSDTSTEYIAQHKLLKMKTKEETRQSRKHLFGD